MPFSALPLELVRKIFEFLAVDRFWAETTLEARLVNVLFSKELFDALARARAFDGQGPHDRELESKKTDPDFDGYLPFSFQPRLLYRSKDFIIKYMVAADRYHKNTSVGTLQYVVDALVKLNIDDTRDHQQLRADYITRLYNLVPYGTWSLLNELTVDLSEPSMRAEHIRPHLVSAAIVVDLPPAIIKALIEEPFLVDKYRTEIWRDPLGAALSVGNLEIARFLIDRHRFVESNNSYITPAVNGECPYEAVDFLLEPQNIHIAFVSYFGYDSIHSYEDAVARALRLDMPDLCERMYKKGYKLPHERFPYYSRSRMISAVSEAACTKGNLSILRMCIQDGGSVDEFLDDTWDNPCDANPVLPSLVEICAFKGDEDMLGYLLEQGANPHGGAWAKHLKGVDPQRDNMTRLSKSIARSMLACLWEGRLGSAQILLNAGVTLPSWTWEDILDVTAQRPQAVSILELLLDKKRICPRKFNDLYPKQRPAFTQLWYMCEAARVGNTDFIWLMSRYGVPIDDEAEYEYEHVELLPQPIIVAKAWNQHETVDLLKWLGARDLDPLESPWKAKFESGMLPQEPPSLAECPMPYDLFIDWKLERCRKSYTAWSEARHLSLRDVMGLYRRSGRMRVGFHQVYLDPATEKRRIVNSVEDLYQKKDEPRSRRSLEVQANLDCVLFETQTSTQ